MCAHQDTRTYSWIWTLPARLRMRLMAGKHGLANLEVTLVVAQGVARARGGGNVCTKAWDASVVHIPHNAGTRRMGWDDDIPLL